jgi:hypothetical protein
MDRDEFKGRLIGTDPQGRLAYAHTIRRDRDLKAALAYVSAKIDHMEAQLDLADALERRSGTHPDTADAAQAHAIRMAVRASALAEVLQADLLGWAHFYLHSDHDQRALMVAEARSSIQALSPFFTSEQG